MLDGDSAGRNRGRPRARLYGLKEMADYLHCSRSTFYELLAEGLPGLRVGSTWRFDRAEVLRWLDERTARLKAEAAEE